MTEYGRHVEVIGWLGRLWYAYWHGAGPVHFFGGIVQAVLVVLGAILIYRAVGAAIRRVLVSKRVRGRYLDRRQADTLVTSLASLLRYLLYVLVLGTLLPLLGVDVRTLVAAAGIGGVALAFGAQHLIRDVINGFFLISEDQLAVGDLVTAAGVTGMVEDVGLRITKIREADGRLHIIPNGQIAQVTNHSTPARTGTVDVPVGPRSDLRALENLVARVCGEFGAARGEFLEPPRLVGLVPTGIGLGLRVSFKAEATREEQLEIGLRRALYLAVIDAGWRWTRGDRR